MRRATVWGPPRVGRERSGVHRFAPREETGHIPDSHLQSFGSEESRESPEYTRSDTRDVGLFPSVVVVLLREPANHEMSELHILMTNM